MTREEKKQERIDRYNALLAKANKESTAAYNRSRDMVGSIPMGQPILVGHHSERGHRRLLDRSWDTMGRSVKLSEKADYYASKARAAECNDSIYLEDQDAVERLSEKVKNLETKQEKMKAINKIVRNKKLTNDAKIDQIEALGFPAETAQNLLRPDCMGVIGIASFSLTNNNATLRTAKERLEQVIKLKSAVAKEYEINGVKVVENPEANRLQLFFNGKPSDEIRASLKRNGFRWTPSQGCWQSYLNPHQIYRASELLK